MSFQDFTSSARHTTPKPPSSGGLPAKDPLAQISEALTQYQRNVAILEKIVQSLTTQGRSLSASGLDELQQQYQAQADVIGQLEDRVRRLLAGAGQRTAADKLRRDFERVQARATALQSGVARLREEQAKLRKNQQQFEKHSAELGVSPTPTLDHYQQVQLQLQQDRLHEEIMREREEEIRNINRGMHQVNEIYKDLAHIVGTQQEQIDSIETQMEDSRANAESGLKQVEKANEKFGNSQCVIS